MSPGPFFHGTSRPLAPGEALVPGGSIGRDNYPGIDTGHGDRVHVTTSVTQAVLFALAASAEDDSEEADAFVYEVRPHGAVAPDPGGVYGEDFVCARAFVVREVEPDE